MRVLLLIILSLMFNSSSWAYLTAGKVAVTATSSSSGVPSTSQDSDITDTKGSSVAVGVPVAVTGNMNITGVYQVNGTPISATSNWNQSGSTINYTAGNVGIGSITPGQALDVQGTVRATSFTGQGGSGIFGAWVSKSTGTAYQATTDGIVIAYQGSGTGVMIGYTDSNSSPSTVRATETNVSSNGVSFSFPVRKNDYYEVTISSGSATVYFLPLGS